MWLFAKKGDLKRGAMDGKRFYALKTQHFAKKKRGCFRVDRKRFSVDQVFQVQPNTRKY